MSTLKACWCAQAPYLGKRVWGNQAILTSYICGSVTLSHSGLSRPSLSQVVLKSLTLSDQGLVIRGKCGGRRGLEGSRRPIRWDSPSYTRGGLVLGGSQISVLVSRGPDSWEAQATPTYCGPNAHKQGTEGARGWGKGLLL